MKLNKKMSIINSYYYYYQFLFMAGCQKKDTRGPLTRSEFLMDTYITLKIYDKKDKDILDKAIDRLKEIEDRMSATMEDQ